MFDRFCEKAAEIIQLGSEKSERNSRREKANGKRGKRSNNDCGNRLRQLFCFSDIKERSDDFPHMIKEKDLIFVG